MNGWERIGRPWILALLLLAAWPLGDARFCAAAEAVPAATTAAGATVDDPNDPNAVISAAEQAELDAQAAIKERRASVRFWVMRAALATVMIAVLIGIFFAHHGKVLPIRDIAGLLVFEEAVSRATEMGQPTLFTTGGACDLRRVQLFASMPLLRRVSELSGELGNRLIVPVCYPETMPVHINAIKDGFADAGTMEMFRAEDVRYFPGGQFFFAIASMGWMLEERPATCFYFGHWEADSLLFAETGQTLGAMQIAGTDQLYQIPFFVASCDYTIIGEEFWAASAKISQDPYLLGSLGAQDVFKLGVLALIALGCALYAVPPIGAFLGELQAALK